MNCTNHNFAGASGICVTCGKPHCSDCLVEVSGKYQCRECLATSKQNNINSSPQYYQPNSSSQYIDTSEPSNNTDTGKAFLWALLVLFLPFIGVFAGKAKPFGKTGNIICQVIGWTYIISVVAVIVMVIAFGLSQS